MTDVEEVGMTDVIEPKYKTYGQYIGELGADIANRATVLAAMDCLIHHLALDEDGEADVEQWESMAIPNVRNWDVLDWDLGEGAQRCKSYMELAQSLSEASFECICHTFADIIRGQCFSDRYSAGRFMGGEAKGKK